MPRRIPLLVLAAALCAGGLARAEQPPAVNYKLHCMGCHLADGSGGPPAVPDVRKEMGCLLIVDGGRKYLVQVPGAALAPISDAELAAVLNYMLETFSAGTVPEAYAPFTAEEVARWRGDWLTQVAAIRKTLLAELPPRCPAGA
ncbi:MAG TPA: hypothetical protein VFG91_14280 [Woeseiaceae bacterium]|nr:hypothetical protein [Woeseiaceae bacterium]